MREIAEAVLLIGELDQRTENHSGRIIESKSSWSPVHVLRSYRSVLFGKPILLLCISFSFLFDQLLFETVQVFLMSSHSRSLG